MKIRYALLFLAAAAVLVAGCGSSSDSSSDKKLTKAQKAQLKDAANKKKFVKEAEKAFDKASKDINACRNLGMAWISKASPASSTDPKKPAPIPKDHDESLDAAVKVLKKCIDIDPKDRGVQQLLASTYMNQRKYDKASPLLEQLAKSASAQEKANAYYAWGFSESNAENYGAAIKAWSSFVDAAPRNDPRIQQVRQSIKALRAAAKAKAAAAASSSKDDSSDKDDK